MPKMGESIAEATIINWLKNVGDFVNAEEIILEIATDKVDSEVPSPVSGIITAIYFQKDDVVAVGAVLAKIEVVGDEVLGSSNEDLGIRNEVVGSREALVDIPPTSNLQPSTLKKPTTSKEPTTFLSPLIISIAQKENISIEELQTIESSGTEITKLK